MLRRNVELHVAEGHFCGLSAKGLHISEVLPLVLAHERRRVVHFAVTEHPTQEWTMQQMREAFPWDQAPRFVLRDRDAIYGRDFAAMTRHMGREEVLTAPQSPLAKPLCGTASGLHPTRVPGPHYPVE